MIPEIALAITEPASTLLQATAVGLACGGGMGLFKAYHNPVFGLLSRLPRGGQYHPPGDDKRKQLSQFEKLDGLDVKIDKSDGEIPNGQTDGFEIGPFGVPGIIISASAFENSDYLSAIVTHELGHRERRDPMVNGAFVATIGGLAGFSAVLLKEVIVGIIGGVNRYFIAGLTILSLGLVVWCIRFYGNFSQNAEFDADRRSVRHLGSPESLRKLLKLYKENRDDDREDGTTLSSWIFGPEQHPHPKTRLEKLDEEYGSSKGP